MESNSGCLAVVAFACVVSTAYSTCDIKDDLRAIRADIARVEQRTNALARPAPAPATAPMVPAPRAVVDVELTDGGAP